MSDDDDDRCGEVTPEEALEILARFCHSHFDGRMGDNGREKARISIPADPKRDDDLRMHAFIKQSARLRERTAAQPPAQPAETKYPELEKMRAVKKESALLTRFVDWLEENDMPICRLVHYENDDGEYVRLGESYERLFARFFEIDLTKVEEERRALLEEQRELNERSNG